MGKKKLLKKILIGLTAIGPGLFLIGYNIGTGSITTMAKVGAEHGMTLTWALVLSCIFTYILMVAYGQTTLVTGKTALSTIKTGFKYGTHFRVYKGDPEKEHALYLVHAVSTTYHSTWPEISRAVRLAHGVKKELLLGRAHKEKSEYVSLKRMRP